MTRPTDEDHTNELRRANAQLRAELARARDDLEQTRDRLGYALHQVAELRRRIPSAAVTQAAVPGGEAPEREADPLERMFAAIRRAR